MRAHLAAPREELLGQSLATVITSERAEAWVSRWRSPTRQQVAAAVANRLLHPAELPAQAAADPLPRWHRDCPGSIARPRHRTLT